MGINKLTKTTKAVVDCAETQGWHVDVQQEKKCRTILFEFSKFTPAGQDFSFSATMKGNSLDSLISDMEDYYEGFDVDTETYLWLDGNGHGKRGAPYRMKDVLQDMEEAEKMIEKLLDAITELAL